VAYDWLTDALDMQGLAPKELTKAARNHASDLMQG
jgi:hypothetical protein